MAIQRHPVDSFDKKVNFWEEFPDYKIHQVFGKLWVENRKAKKLQASSNFMWALTLCYDRKSSFYPQPEGDKWEAVSEDIFGSPKFLINLAYAEETQNVLILPFDLRFAINEFEKTIDTPLGMDLRRLEKKFQERTLFIEETKYSMDYYEQNSVGKNILKKGTADQLDRMFRDTGKIGDQLQKALDELKASEGMGDVKGGGIESKGDGDKNF